MDAAQSTPLELTRDGELLGIVNGDLRLPAALTIAGDNVVVAELNERVTILDKTGAVVMRVRTNAAEGFGSNRVAPEQWRTGYVIAPHGVATNAEGDLFVAEQSAFGRVLRLDRR